MANKVVVTYGGRNVHIASLQRGDTLKLVPGANVIDAATWARFSDPVKGSTAISSQVRVGTIKVARQIEVPEGAPGAAGGSDAAAAALASMKTKDAVALVRETFDVDLLKAWDAATADRKVQAAIAGQLDLILNSKPGDNGGDGE